MKGMISAVIIVAIVIASTIIVITSVSSVTKSAENMLGFSEDRRSMAVLNAKLNELWQESEGSSRSISVNVKNGLFTSDSKNDSVNIVFFNDVLDKGTLIRDDNTILSRGPFASAYETERKGFAEFVLENDAMLFSVRKIGNSTYDAPIDADGIVTELTNKKTNTTIVPILMAEKDGFVATTGHTSMTSNGMQSGSILVITDAYTMTITLSAGHEFLDIEVS